ncbi:hypothetical protein [Arthrobacter sp. Marseille-P9274]|uniref:hypothetical protein n=1 Tax=Arthrobacter sp. Marseille-P9274 TaxID=2866572 RepID=UPI0021C9E240|nr:hypothetical protein [Arthrobacter sp. Marseille-P9274]
MAEPFNDRPDRCGGDDQGQQHGGAGAVDPHEGLDGRNRVLLSVIREPQGNPEHGNDGQDGKGNTDACFPNPLYGVVPAVHQAARGCCPALL